MHNAALHSDMMRSRKTVAEESESESESERRRRASSLETVETALSRELN